MGKKSAQNLLEEIEASKQRGLARLIYALGIRFVGERTGQLLATHFGSLHSLAQAALEELTEVPEVGPKVAQSIADFFSEAANRDLVKRLEKQELKMVEVRQQPVDTRLAGKTFVFTGSLERHSREQAGAEVVRHGGKISSSVSKRTDYVVAGADPGSKLAKATALGVTVLDEDAFEKLLTDGHSGSLPEAGAAVSAQTGPAGRQKRTREGTKTKKDSRPRKKPSPQKKLF